MGKIKGPCPYFIGAKHTKFIVHQTFSLPLLPHLDPMIPDKKGNFALKQFVDRRASFHRKGIDKHFHCHAPLFGSDQGTGNLRMGDRKDRHFDALFLLVDAFDETISELILRKIDLHISLGCTQSRRKQEEQNEIFLYLHQNASHFIIRANMKKRAIYYDTETTGINAQKDRIIEIAAYDPEEDRSFCEFVNPGFPIPPEATAVHHITDEMVAQAPTFDEIGKRFAEFCPENTVLIAHNNDGFDKHFIEAEYGRNGLEMPDWIYFDSLKWARRYRPDLPRHALQHLREIYGIEANNAHRALDDVMVLYQVFSLMIDDLSIETCLELLNAPRVLNRMPFGKHQGKPLDKVPKSYIAWLAESGAFDKPQNQELKESFEKIGVL